MVSYNNERFILISWLIFQGLFIYLLFISGQCSRKFWFFFPEFWFGNHNVSFTDFTWYYMHLLVRFSQFQNYHTNMKRLDITLTKFIKLHDCIPVNVRFAVYTPNFLSVNGMSWYKTNFYTEDPFVFILCSFSSLLASEARFSGSWSFSVLEFQHYSVSKNLVFLQTERRAM